MTKQEKSRIKESRLIAAIKFHSITGLIAADKPYKYDDKLSQDDNMVAALLLGFIGAYDDILNSNSTALDFPVKEYNATIEKSHEKWQGK